jgi:serine/threonine-protein kinase
MAAAAPHNHDHGDRILEGRYRLVEILACKASSTVWRGYDERLLRPVVVEVLHIDRSHAQRARDEAQALARLAHPHIAAVFDYGVSNGRPYLVMELVDGCALAPVLADRGLPWPVAVACCAQIAAAVAAAHAGGLVHGDITPVTIKLTPSGVKLAGFGVSPVGGGEIDPDGELRDTSAYAAPERLHTCTASPAVDVYSVGMVLYRALAGRLPWPAGTPGQLLAAKRTTNPDPLPTIDGLPTDVAQACMDCLARDPGQRPSAAQLAELLHAATPPDAAAQLAALAPAGPSAAVTPLLGRPAPDRPAASSTRRKAVRAAVAGASLVIVGVVAWTATGWGPADDPAASQAIAAPPAARATPACTVSYQPIANDRRRLDVTMTVHARQPLPPGWRLAIHSPAQQPGLLAGGGWRYDSGVLTSPPQAALPAGRSVQLRLSDQHSGTSVLPDAFAANEHPCTATLLSSDGTPMATPRLTTLAKTDNVTGPCGQDGYRGQGYQGGQNNRNRPAAASRNVPAPPPIRSASPPTVRIGSPLRPVGEVSGKACADPRRALWSAG